LKILENGWRVIKMELIPNNEVFQEDKRNTKKMMLPTDAVCTKCGIIFNSVYEDSCLICEDYSEIKKETEKPVIRFVEEKDERGQDICQHTDFIMGRQSVDLRILLDFHVEDIRALCEIHGCPEGGSRGKMVVNIMKHLHSNLDKRIDERLVRKMIVRNRKKFRFWRDIEDAINRAKKPGKIRLVQAEECLDITEIPMNKS
jgi:hypothetical protein